MSGEGNHPESESIACAVERTLSASDKLAFDATIGVRHTLRANVDTALAGTLAAPRTSSQDGPQGGPDTVDLRSLPQIAVAGAGSVNDVEADLTLGRVLGEGGMGVVLLARQRSLQREVALKRVRDQTGDEAHAAALLREAAFTGYLEHPNIVPVHALGRDADGRPVLVMKRIEGITLAALLRDPANPSWARAGDDRLGFLLRALRDVCDALSFAHARGVLHRDIKPENVMLGAFGEVYLLDWGVALRRDDRLSDDAIVGTPVYMAPEMLRPGSEPIDERTDVYLLGATLHECLVLAPPHQGQSMREVLVSIARSAPREYPVDVPEELADIVRRAMHADRNQRFASAEALGRALSEFERHRAAAALAKVAVERLAELEDAIARGAASAVVEPLFHECRFGFEQSLRAWPENRRAREELRRALTRMCGFEIAQTNRASAATLLALIDEPPSDLSERLAALDRELEHDVAERDRLRRLDHEMDPTVAERERKLAVRGAAVLLFLFAMSLTAGYVLHVFTPTAGGMVAFMVPTLVLIAAVSMRFRKQLFQNRVGRQMGLTIAVAAVAVTVNRTLGYVHTRPFADILSGDSLILATLAAVSALSLRRVYLVPATLFTAAAIIAPRLGTLAFVPMLSAAILSVATVVRSPERLRTPLL